MRIIKVALLLLAVCLGHPVLAFDPTSNDWKNCSGQPQPNDENSRDYRLDFEKHCPCRVKPQTAISKKRCLRKKIVERKEKDAQFLRDTERFKSFGHAYRKGTGVPQSFALAHMWFNLAAARGDLYAEKERDSLAQSMSSAQIAEAQRLAVECQRKDYKDC